MRLLLNHGSSLRAGLACALAALAATGCESAPARSAAPAKTAAAGEPAGRPDGVKPDLGPKDLDPRGLDSRWSIYLAEKIRQLWVLDDTVYIFTKKNNLYSLGLDDGFVRWQYTVAAPDVKDALSFAPAVYSYKKDGIARKDELFLISKDTLHCLDKEAGFALWKKALPFAAASSPAASSSHVYVGAWDNRVYAIDKSDQTIGWTYRTNGPVTARADASEKTVESVFVASEDGAVYSLSPTHEERKWACQTRGPIVGRPMFFRNFVYAGSKDYILYCIRALDGNVEWRYPTGGPITKDPVAYSRDTVYVVSGESNLLAVNLQPDVKKEYVRWRFDKGEQVLAKGRRDVYVLDTNSNVVALADESGKQRWNAPLATGADFFAMDPFDPTSLVERERRLASTLVLGYQDGWILAVKEKNEF
jgi:outer membrane protein assembly factor BamB